MPVLKIGIGIGIGIEYFSFFSRKNKPELKATCGLDAYPCIAVMSYCRPLETIPRVIVLSYTPIS